MEILHDETWTHASGLTCQIVLTGWPEEFRGMSEHIPDEWWVGYVTPPAGCPNLDDTNINVHGGITCPSDAVWVGEGDVGFDCNHAGDAGQWDRDKVFAETERLAAQIAAVAGPVVLLAHGTREVVNAPQD